MPLRLVQSILVAERYRTSGALVSVSGCGWAGWASRFTVSELVVVQSLLTHSKEEFTEVTTGSGLMRVKSAISKALPGQRQKDTKEICQNARTKKRKIKKKGKHAYKKVTQYSYL